MIYLTQMKARFYKYLVIVSLFLLSFQTYAQLSFTENKGQWPAQVVYKTIVPNGAVFFEKTGMTFLIIQPIRHAFLEDGLDAHASEMRDPVSFRIVFNNANNKLSLTANKKSHTYSNYYLGKDQSKWATQCYDYSSITYSELYPGIDLHVIAESSYLKYEFHLKPGANAKDIRMDIEGDVEAFIRDGNLVFKNEYGEIIDYAPFAYHQEDSKQAEIESRYKLRKNQLSYKLGKYDKSKTIVIDPYLVFSTYSGSAGDNWGTTATFDEHGNVFSGGIMRQTGYPVDSLSYDSVFNASGKWDAAIIKYDSSGTYKLWSTYLGGNGGEIPHSMIAASNNDLFIMGTTGSYDFPVDSLSYDTTFAAGDSVNYLNNVLNNGSDIFVVRLMEDGTELLGSTYLGGTKNDGLNYRPGTNFYLSNSLYANYGDGARGEIMIDEQDNVYIGSCTFSDDFPVAGNPVQDTIRGEQEGVICMLDPLLQQLYYSTYFGTRNDDAIYSIDIDHIGNIFVAGGTRSDTLEYALKTLPNADMGGEATGFVAKINPGVTTPLAVCMFGTEMYDQVYFVKVNDKDSVYIAGQTKALNNELIINAHYGNNNGGQFIAQLTTNLDSIIWSTQFGIDNGRPDLSLTAFSIGLNHNLYIAGWAIDGIVDPSTSFVWATFDGIKDMDITETAFQPESDGADFYLMVISDDGNCLKYSTFFGEQHYWQCNPSGRDHVDGGTSRFDKRGYMYQAVCASCGGCDKFPTYPSPGVYSELNNSSNCNNAVFKFELVTPKYLPDLHFCENDSNFLGPIDPDTAITYEWTPAELVEDPFDPNTMLKTTDNALMTLYMRTAYCTDSVLQPIAFHMIDYDLQDEIDKCDYETKFIAPDYLSGNAAVQWALDRDFVDVISSNTTLEVATDSSQYFYFRAYNDYCEYVDSIKVNVHNVLLNADPTYIICSGDVTQLQIVNEYPEQEITYEWTPASLIIDGANTANPTVSITESTQFFVYSENDYGCQDKDTIVLDVSEFSEWNGNPIPMDYDSIFRTQHSSIVTAVPFEVLYNWTPAYGLNTTDGWSVIATPENDTVYYLQLEDIYGCTRSDSVHIYVEEVFCDETHVFVPSAFTPNDDGQNDELFVYSRMVSEVVFTVYNRWGEIVFETTDTSKGWDGTYNGEELPPGVFVFHLQVVCWDGSEFANKGNITLLR